MTDSTYMFPGTNILGHVDTEQYSDRAPQNKFRCSTNPIAEKNHKKPYKFMPHYPG